MKTDADGKKHFIVGPPEEMFVARVPIYGDLRFLDRDGQPSQKGAARVAGSLAASMLAKNRIIANSLRAAGWRSPFGPSTTSTKTRSSPMCRRKNAGCRWK